MSKRPTESTNKVEEMAVIEAVEAMTGAFEARDIDGVLDTYLPGAVVVFEPEQPVDDMATIRAKFLELFALAPKFTYGGHEAFVSKDVAVHIAPWTMTGTAPDGQTISQRGLSVAVLRKDEEGKWRLVLDDPHGQWLLERAGEVAGAFSS